MPDLPAIRFALHQAIQTIIQPQRRTTFPALCRAVKLPQVGPVPQGQFDSKSQYLERRLDAVSDDELIGVAEAFVKQYPFGPSRHVCFELEELLAATRPVLGLTKKDRHAIADALSIHDLELGDGFLPLLRSLFKLSLVPGWGMPDLEDEIVRHVLSFRGDWPTEELFSQLKAYDVSEERFARLLQGLVSCDVCPSEKGMRFTATQIANALGQSAVEFREVGYEDGYPVFRLARRGGYTGGFKQLIFASRCKPDIRLPDAINNEIEILTHRDAVLVYDRPIPPAGLLWRDLQAWYADLEGVADSDAVKDKLYTRLKSSLPENSPPQQRFFRAFFKTYGKLVHGLPALLPEVSLHWDPKSLAERGPDAFLNTRMDFLMLIRNDVRVILEVDGAQHYSSPAKYAEMAAGDRDLKLARYELYRFGGKELGDGNAESTVRTFFERLFKTHGITPVP